MSEMNEKQKKILQSAEVGYLLRSLAEGELVLSFDIAYRNSPDQCPVVRLSSGVHGVEACWDGDCDRFDEFLLWLNEKLQDSIRSPSHRPVTYTRHEVSK